MEEYKRETQEIINRFLLGQTSFEECIAALDAAIAAFMPLLTREEADEVHAVMLANNETVMKEMERRGTPRHSSKRKSRFKAQKLPQRTFGTLPANYARLQSRPVRAGLGDGRTTL